MSNFSGKISCAVGAPLSMKIASLGRKSFTFSTGFGAHHSSAFPRNLFGSAGAVM
jgi:hypothetical protein